MKTARDLIDRQDLQSLAKRRDLPGIIFMISHLALCLLTGLVLHFALGTWLVLPAMLLHGLVIVHFFSPFHEASHYTAFRTRKLNDLTAWLTGLIVNLPPTHFRLEHRAHHAYTQDPAHDPEMITHTQSRLGILIYVTAVPYFQAVLSSLLRHPFGRFNDAEKQFLPLAQRPKVVREARIMWLVYGAIGLIAFLSSSWAPLTYWLVPRVLAEPFMRMVRMAEHGALPHVPDMLKNTRTVKSLLPVRLLGWNMSYHAEHHCLPSVPFHALPALHEYLKHDIADLRESYAETQIHIIKSAA
jgi:fatty acid desaturase